MGVFSARLKDSLLICFFSRSSTAHKGKQWWRLRMQGIKDVCVSVTLTAILRTVLPWKLSHCNQPSLMQPCGDKHHPALLLCERQSLTSSHPDITEKHNWSHQVWLHCGAGVCWVGGWYQILPGSVLSQWCGRCSRCRLCHAWFCYMTSRNRVAAGSASPPALSRTPSGEKTTGSVRERNWKHRDLSGI